MKLVLYWALLFWGQLALADPPTGYIQDFDANFNVPNWPGVLDWNTLPAYDINHWQLPHFISHTPNDQDFGLAHFVDGQFDDPSGQPSPFWTGWNHFYINAWQANGQYYSGLISSVDTYGNGFSAVGGYWEAQIQVPSGGWTWPAFWLNDLNTIQRNARSTNAVEVDIMECKGFAPNQVPSLVHLWTPSGQDIYGKPFNTANLGGNGICDLHVYGCLINPDLITVFIDGARVWQTPTPTEALTHPLYVMIDLAAAFPIGNNGTMAVQYLKHWKAPVLTYTYTKWQAQLTSEEGTSPTVQQLSTWISTNPPFTD